MKRTITLRDLLGEPDVPALDVTGIACDSRRVRPGDLYVARRGRVFDGHEFAAAAVAAGAVAVVSERPVDTEVANVVAPDVAGHPGELAARFYNEPSRTVDIVGVTGTNGKTTVAYNIAAIAGGDEASYMGTLGWGRPGALSDAALTTEDAAVVQARLRALADEGISRVALEASSHALDQGRLDQVAMDVGVFTNLSRDHLDYHGTMARYAAAKRRLFDAGLRTAVVNVDDPEGRAIVEQLDPAVEAFGVGRSGAVRWTDVEFRRDGLAGVWETPWGRGPFSLPSFYGEFSVYNAACVLASCCALGDRFADVVAAMAELPPVPGRMQAIAASPTVFVDYAHTPEGLAAVLGAIRSHVGRGRVLTVFGCGGDRDRGKRPLMAQAVEAGSDVVVATTDNPRSESPERILDDVMAGFDDPGRVLRITDRREAIAAGLETAGSDDVVLIAGKGHEDYQEVAGRRLAWSDAGVVRELLGNGRASEARAPGRCGRRGGPVARAGGGDRP